MGTQTTIRSETNSTENSILVVGKKSIIPWGEDICEAFAHIGIRSRLFQWNSFSLSRTWHSVRHRSRGLSNPAAADRLVKTVNSMQPKAVLFLWHYGLTAELAKRIRKATGGTRLVGWISDCRHIRATYGDAMLAVFDYVYYFDTWMREQLLKIYPAKNCFYLPLAVNPKRYFGNASERIEAIAFVGTVTADREAVLQELRQSSIPVKVFGPQRHSVAGKVISRRLSSKRCANLYTRHLISLNIYNEENTKHGLNFRAFEVPATGSLLLTPICRDLPSCFEVNREVLGYKEISDIPKIYRHVRKNPDWAAQIAQAGHQRVMESHTFAHRAQEIAKTML